MINSIEFNYDALGPAAKGICDKYGIRTAADLWHFILKALKMVYFQPGPNCFAAAMVINWRAEYPDLIVDILKQFFTKGEFEFLDGEKTLSTMKACVPRSNPSALELIVHSLCKLFEDTARKHGDITQFDNIAKAMQDILDGIKIPFLREAYADVQKKLEGKKIGDVFMAQYERLGCTMKHRTSGYFTLSMPLTSFLRTSGLPGPVRKYLIWALAQMPGNVRIRHDDVYFGGHCGSTRCKIFSGMACTPVIEACQPGEFLSKIIALQNSDGFPDMKLAPAEIVFTRDDRRIPECHMGNAIFPGISDINSIKDGEFIPLFWTGWDPPKSQFGVIRRGGKYEWVDSTGQHVDMLKIAVFDPRDNRFSTPTSEP
ncbi:MAG: hypothetical protein LBD72_00090 [Puniceicoccales bacterium]|jgi:hypothetical protein|nr:hypothetical protein [Puniceicoccales bacterium]